MARCNPIGFDTSQLGFRAGGALQSVRDQVTSGGQGRRASEDCYCGEKRTIVHWLGVETKNAGSKLKSVRRTVNERRREFILHWLVSWGVWECKTNEEEERTQGIVRVSFEDSSRSWRFFHSSTEVLQIFRCDSVIVKHHVVAHSFVGFIQC